jgi:O-antigen ligase
MKHNLPANQHTLGYPNHVRPLMMGQPAVAIRHPYPLASIVLSFYVITIVILSKNPSLADVSQYVGFALAGIFALELLVSRSKLFLPVEFSGFWIFLALMTISALWAPAPGTAISLSLTFLQLLIFAIIGINILVGQHSIRPLAFGLIAGLVWAVIVALQEQDFSLMASASYSRIASVLLNANTYAIVLLIGCMVAWYLFQTTEKKIVKMALAILILLFLHQIIFYAGSRKGLLSVFLVYPVFLSCKQFFSKHSSIKQFFITLVLLTFFLVSVWWVVNQSIFFVRLERVMYDLLTGAGTRNDMVRFGLNLWLEKPILGQGAGQFRVFYALKTYSHNNYIELLANNGLIGLIAFYSFFVLFARKCLRLYKSGTLSVSVLSWSLSFLVLILFLDTAMVSYYEKSTWLAYIALMSLAYLSQSIQDKQVLEVQ